ncbi:MAG: mycothiol system anti-sigma-R factor [Streptomyces sp.]|uniref:mycothiol system anti-sigma-R factor n=1 Tax=Streptomyces sp. TaxID=1931 RepID=UPI003D6A554A
MSCGEPHETDCSEVLDHLYEYLDREMPDSDCAKFQEHFDECSPCLEKYGLEQEVKKLVKRCCGHDDVPEGLRSKVMGRIELIRAAERGEERTGELPDPVAAPAVDDDTAGSSPQPSAGRKKYA